MTTSTPKSRKYCYIDTEFNRTTERNLGVVSAAFDCYVDGVLVESGDYFVHKDPIVTAAFRNKIIQLVREGYVFVCWSVEAEARFFISCGIEECFRWEESWIDLYLEYRMLLNHCNAIGYGKQYQDGKEVFLSPWKDAKGSASLVSACYKLLKVKIDSEWKDRMRELILSDPYEFTPEQQREIQEYNRSDIKYLPKLLAEINRIYTAYYSREDIRGVRAEVLKRGNYAARTARMVTDGYPINYEKTKNFSDNVPNILNTCIQDIVQQFPDNPPFRWDKKDLKYKMNQKLLREWIFASGLDKGWELTDAGSLSLSFDAWKDKFPYRHEFPRGNLGAQIVRYLGIKQSMNGFVQAAGKDRKSFWDYVGSDKRVRPYFNIYGAQSSRSQPAATGYMHLKSAWVRSLVEPPKGYAMCGIDYSSQEFLIGALLSGDDTMYEAYASGDPYMYFGKEFGVIPKNGTKKTHAAERDACKSTVLGMMFLMTEVGLSRKLSMDTGRFYSESDALAYIDGFNDIFGVFNKWRMDNLKDYNDMSYARLADGWTMWGDNTQFRSVANFPVQGHGAVVMREAVRLCQDAGLKIPITLHDALYQEFCSRALSQVDLQKRLMHQAFVESFSPELREKAKVIRMDAEVWSPDYPEETRTVLTPGGIEVKKSRIFVDKRSKTEYETYKQYFESELGIEHL